MVSTYRKPALWGGIYILMLLSLLTPLSIITIHILIVPLVILFAVADRVPAFITVAIIMLLSAFILPGIGTFLSLLTLFYLTPAALMARFYRKDQNAGQAILAGIVSFIALILGLLVILSIFQFNLSEFMSTALKGDASLLAMLTNLFGADYIDQAIELLVLMVPLTIIIFSVYTVVLSHWVSRKVLTRYYLAIPKLKPMKEWKLPKSLIWYYLILLLLEMFFVFEKGSAVYVILLNAVPLLTYVIALQGIGLLYYIAEVKGWNRALPIVGIVLLPIMPQLISWVGVLDLAFPVRSKLAAPKD